MPLGKFFKWGASTLRVSLEKLRLGGRLVLPRGGKPVYLGKGVRLLVWPGGSLELGRGAYLDDRTRLEVGSGASMSIGEGVYMNTNCRVVAIESIAIGAHTFLGPNACIYDHDHVFDAEGVHAEVVAAPVRIGERCWLGANAIVTAGVDVVGRTCVGGGCVVTRSLLDPGVYVGSPARLAHATTHIGSRLDEEKHAGDVAPQGLERPAPSCHQKSPHEEA